MRILLIIIACFFIYPATGQQRVATNNLPDTIFTRPTVLASYPGGDTAWKRYVKKHLKYPRKAWWDEMETDITVRVVINSDGTIASAQHLNTAGYGYEQEAVRLVLKSGKWIPATFMGNPVKSQGELIIEFRLR